MVVGHRVVSDFSADIALLLRDDAEVVHQKSEKAADGGDDRDRDEHRQQRELRPAALRGGHGEAYPFGSKRRRYLSKSLRWSCHTHGRGRQ
jgi:hypothetical protein